MITISSHKIEGPKGVGALIVGPEVIKSRGLSPLILGGGQEQGLRSGTENVPAIAAFGEAVRLAKGCVSDTNGKCSALRDKLINMLSDASFSAISITRPPIHAPHILNITLPSIRSETMLHFLSAKGIFVSSGSACSSNSADVSSALIAYGRTPEEADCSIRISFSHRNTEEEVEIFAQALAEGLERLARRRR
jgi:cysteine desulfurase